jgi:ABC-type multidrug transport system fused ATPase/permease subunit
VTAHTHTDDSVPEDESPVAAAAPVTTDGAGGGGAAGTSGPAEPAPEALSMAVGARLILRFVRMHPGPFALSLLGGVGWALMIVATSEALGWVTDEVIAPAFDTGISASEAWLAVAVLVGVGLARGITVVLRRWFGSVTEARMQRSLRGAVAERLLEMPMESYRKRPTGQLLATSDVDVTTATQMLMPLPFSLGVVALIAVSLVSLWRADPAFALVALVLFPALAVLSKYYTTRIHEPSGRVQERLGVVSSIAHESFDGVMVVKTMAREEAEAARFGEAAGRLADERIGLARLTSVFEPLITALPNLGMIALLLVGAARIEQGGATVGQLVQAIALFGWLAFPMRVVGFLFQALPRAVVSVARVDDLLAEPIDPAYAEGAEGEGADAASAETGRLPQGPLGLEVRDLSFAYGDIPVLRSVSFTAEPGEVLALVGSTGSGKSTLVNLLAHLDTPASGEILLGGIPTDRLDPAELRGAVSVAFQESFLFAESVADNVALGRDVDAAGVRAALDRSLATRFVRALPEGVDTVVGERGVTLSGGQRQRVALARALAGDPRVVVLDDATSAVDPVVESEILSRLRQGDTTMLVVAHRLSTITLADRVVHLSDGAVRGVGTHEELLADPEYSALVTAYEQDEAESAAMGDLDAALAGEGA